MKTLFRALLLALSLIACASGVNAQTTQVSTD